MQNKKTAVYLRVSTDAQLEEGYSIEAQKEMAEAFLKSKGIKNYAFYIDGGYSGSNLLRPSLNNSTSSKISWLFGSNLFIKLFAI